MLFKCIFEWKKANTVAQLTNPIVSSFLFFVGKIIATVLPPVETTGLTSEDVTDLTEKVRNQILEVYQKTSEEVGSAAVKESGDAGH